MAQVEREVENRKDAKNKAKQERKWSGVQGRGQGQSDWTEIDGELLKKAIATVAKMDGAMRLGYTRDGGAFAIGIYGDGTPFTEYYHGIDETEDFLRRVIATYE